MTGEQSWFQKLNRREKTLLILVGTVVFLLFNIFFFRFASTHFTKLQQVLKTRTEEWKIAQQLLIEQKMWDQRTKWLQENQPKAPSDAEANKANVQLMSAIKSAAESNGVLIQDPEIHPIEETPSHTSISISVRTASSWESLLKFLYALKQSESFIVIESTNLETEPKDAKQMRGRFKIARWYAPRSGGG